jgi:hypothetical protein
LASTILHEQGYNHEHIELQLAHAPRNEVSAAYNHALYLEPRAKMMQEWADFLEQTQRGGKVLPSVEQQHKHPVKLGRREPGGSLQSNPGWVASRNPCSAVISTTTIHASFCGRRFPGWFQSGLRSTPLPLFLSSRQPWLPATLALGTSFTDTLIDGAA